MAAVSPAAKQRRAAYTRRWKAANLERTRAAIRAHYYRNKPRYRARNARRKRHIRQATPSWANDHKIEAFYRLAAFKTRTTGIPHVVDHIVPLRSPLVCGLHCPANLRVITHEENQKKSNSFTVE